MSSTDSERRGILLLVVAAFSFSVMSLQVKLAGEELPVAMLVLARGVVTLVMSVAWIRYRRIPMWGVDRPRLLLRGVLGLGGLACFFYAVTALPLAEEASMKGANAIGRKTRPLVSTTPTSRAPSGGASSQSSGCQVGAMRKISR